MQSLCTLRHRCRQRPRNTRYQAGATPYLGRTCTGWIAPACGWRTHSITSSARASNVGGSRENGAASAQKAHEKNESLRQLWSYFPTLAFWSEIATASELRKAADYGKERLVLLRRFPLEQALGLPSIIGKFSVLRVMRIR